MHSERNSDQLTPAQSAGLTATVASYSASLREAHDTAGFGQNPARAEPCRIADVSVVAACFAEVFEVFEVFEVCEVARAAGCLLHRAEVFERADRDADAGDLDVDRA